MDQTLRRTGGTLASLVTMTVFIKDARYGDRFVQIRREMFPDGQFSGERAHHRVELRPAGMRSRSRASRCGRQVHERELLDENRDKAGEAAAA